MYQALLTRRYLTSKVMPFLAVLAVVLCVAMELIVWSVMGGFLTMLVNSGRTLIGDVKISWPTVGFAYYDDLIDRLEEDPMVQAAAPVIETYARIGLPDNRYEYVQVRGIDGPSFSRVTGYADTLWWKPLDDPLPKDRDRDDPRLYDHEVLQQLFDDGLSLTEREPGGQVRSAAVLGIEVSGWNIRRPEGFYRPGVPLQRLTDGTVETVNQFLPHSKVTFHVIPIDSQGRGIEATAAVMSVANEFRTGLFELDRKGALVHLPALQRMLKMDAAMRLAEGEEPFEYVTDEHGEQVLRPRTPTLEDPARVTSVLVRAAEGNTAEELQVRCREIYAGFAAIHEDVPDRHGILISTWEDENRTFIAAVKKETALVMFIFGVISLTSVFLVLAIFWSMVSEKTQDVGILRAIGASRAGVAWLWVRYGLAIGLAGSILGTIVATLIVRNINPIHDWLGEALGLYIWDPSIYYFTTIPNQIEPYRAVIVFVAGVSASVLGALWPAVRAARMDPVRAIRYE